jgi:hypothetical protein
MKVKAVVAPGTYAGFRPSEIMRALPEDVEGMLVYPSHSVSSGQASGVGQSWCRSLRKVLRLGSCSVTTTLGDTLRVRTSIETGGRYVAGEILSDVGDRVA